MIEYFQIQNKEELQGLKEKSAKYENLNFSFPDEYISKMEKYMEAPGSYQLFAKNKDTNEIAGYIAAGESNRPGFLFIYEVFIDPKFQGKGIGTELVNKIIEYAKKKNLNGIITETEFENIPAQNLYKKVGFAKIHNPEWMEGITYQLTFAPHKK